MNIVWKLTIAAGALALSAAFAQPAPAPPSPPVPSAAPSPAPPPQALDRSLDLVLDLDLPDRGQMDAIRFELDRAGDVLRAMPQIAPIPPIPPLPPVGIDPAIAMQLDLANSDLASLGSTLSAAALAFQAAPQPPDQREAIRAAARNSRDIEKSDRDYKRGQDALEHRDYARAIDSFDRVIDQKNPRADGAFYWRAYAENKLGKRDQALATLAELRKTYPTSRWLDDAKAFEVEVRQSTSSPVTPENASDEELKLLALNSMINTDPERTVPILEKLLKGGSNPRLKERALFVLAQSHSAKSTELLAQVAKGNYNPDLQMKAVEYLGVFGGRENAELLGSIYKSSSDEQVKRAILHSFMVSGSRDTLFSVARTETNPSLRVEAIHQLGVMGGSGELLQLYTPDAPTEVKRAVLQGLFIGGYADKVAEIARNDKDPEMRREAIHQLGPMGRTKAGDALIGLYAKETDPSLKREIINGLFIQNNASALIDIARKESDPNLRREAVQKLSIMHSKEATDYMLELLNK